MHGWLWFCISPSLHLNISVTLCELSIYVQYQCLASLHQSRSPSTEDEFASWGNGKNFFPHKSPTRILFVCVSINSCLHTNPDRGNSWGILVTLLHLSCSPHGLESEARWPPASKSSPSPTNFNYSLAKSVYRYYLYYLFRTFLHKSYIQVSFPLVL